MSQTIPGIPLRPRAAAPRGPVATEAVSVTWGDLPLSCPRPGDTLWNMHPRVYLPIENEPDREAVCPYCGARYRLAD